MKFIGGVLGLLAGFVMFASSANAAIVLSVVSPGAPVTAGTLLNVNVLALGNAADSGIVTTADFSLSGGIFTGPNAGTFGLTGMIGNGNINAAGSSFLRDPGNSSLANLSIEFNTSQLFPAGDQLFATLAIDTTGLAGGTYNINITNADLDGNPGTFSGGTFTITAVPEPTSILTAGFGLVGLWYGRRRMKKKAIA